MEQDSSLASTLIPASNSRSVSLSIYNLTGAFDSVNGNIANIDYGVNGANAIAATQIGDDGSYSWDITTLVDSWITSLASNNGLALSGVFGNVNTDGRNSYGIFHTVGSTTGFAPHLVVPEPSVHAIFGIGILGNARSWSASSQTGLINDKRQAPELRGLSQYNELFLMRRRDKKPDSITLSKILQRVVLQTLGTAHLYRGYA